MPHLHVHLRRLAYSLRVCLVCVAAVFPLGVGFGARAMATPLRPPIDSFIRISDDEGLAHSDVRAIAQDRQGFIWFGLRLGGLTRYDGYDLKVYQHDPLNPKSLGNQVIWCLLVDRRGTLWIGTEGGLERYDRETGTFSHFRHDLKDPRSLSNNVVTCLAEDSAGHLWAGTRIGLCRLDDPEHGQFTNYFRPSVVEGSNSKDTFRSIMEDTTTGLLWLGSSDGAAAFDPRTGAFASFLHDPNDPQSLSRNAVNKIIRGPNGVFWALTEFGLNSFSPTFTRVSEHTVQQPRIVFNRYIQPSGAASPGINFVRDGLFDRKGRLWLATRGGLQLLDQETHQFTTYRRRPGEPTSLSDDLTQAVFEDRSGNIWVATFAGGVSRLRSEGKPFIVYRHHPGDPHSMSEDRVAGLAFDREGHLWAATVNGLNRLDGETWTQFLHDPADPDSIPSNDLSTVATAPNGDVWAGTNYGGLYRYDQHRFHSYPTSPSNAPAPNGWQLSTGSQVNSILADDHGGVWLGARAYGLDYFQDGRFLHYSPRDRTNDAPPQPTNNAIVGVLRPDNTLWFATETSGLVRLNLTTQQFTRFPPPVESPGTTRSLLCISETADGSIWLGATDGLLKFDPHTEKFIRQYASRDGLPNDAVMTIVPDRRGHLWLGTANGLADFDPASEQFRVYEKPDGLPSNVFSQRTGVLGPDGKLYFGTRAGLVAFNPDDLRENPDPPPVVITELRWLGRPPRQANGDEDATVPHVGRTIHVAPGQLGFSLRFSALDFAAPDKNRFRFRLEGWDTEWSSTSAKERTATYTALPPGQYTFRVQASNADRVWNDEGASLRLVVEPYFWQTFWFRLAVAVGSLTVVLLGLQWRLRSVRRRNSQLETQVSLRTGQLQQEIDVRQKAEAALRESHAELERRVQERTAELALMNTSLQAEIAERRNVEAQLRQSQKMEAIGQLAGGIAHDFNNLLTVILGQSELLSDAAMPSEERHAAIRDINAAAQRATNLTRQLLVFSRHQAVNPVSVDLNHVVAGVSKLLRHVIGEHISLETNFSPRPLSVLADPGMLEQVLLNMAVNARDEMPRGGRLTISTAWLEVTPAQVVDKPERKPGLYARFSVSDTGGGIPEEILPQIFEPFFTTKESGKGTGLGLAISLGIVQQHRGWIDVETAVARGTTFHVYLPLQSSVSTVSLHSRTPPPFASGQTTILLAEDETAVRTVVKHVLVRQGHQVIEASSGGDALKAWEQHRAQITLLLTDIVMPGWPNGHELAARLLAEKPQLRVITMSGYDPSEFAAEAGLSETRPHLRKPFTADDLLRAIDNALR